MRLPGKKTIVVEIDDQANIKVETDGFVGAECAKATSALERALGVQSNEELKAEYHQRPATNRMTLKR